MSLPSKQIPELESFSDPYFFYSYEQSFKLIYVSPSIQSVLGYMPEQLIGADYRRLLDRQNPLNREFDERHEEGFRIGGRRTSLQVVCAADQSHKILQVQNYGKFESDGTVAVIHGIAQDVSGFFVNEKFMRDNLIELKQVESNLSEREKTVLSRVLSGSINKKIANELEVSQRAVEQIRSRLLKKFQVKSTAELVGKATELRLLVDVINGVCAGSFPASAFHAASDG